MHFMSCSEQTAVFTSSYRLMCILESLLEDLGPEGIDIQDEIK